MKSKIRIIAVIASVIVIALIVWQATSQKNLLQSEDYPGFVNQETLDIPEDVSAQWQIQLNTAQATYDQNPDDLNSLMNIAFWNQQFGNYAVSRRAIEKVLEKNNINFTAWTILGDTAYKMKDWETAESAYVKSLSLHTDPNLFYKIETVWRAGFPEKYNDIKTLYEDAITLDGQKPFYLTRLADWYAEQDRWQESADHLKVVADLVPEDENARADYESALEKAKAQN